ncbi:HAD family acid phosphatase [Sphingopyxis sp. MC1]|uniref:HAD family acid phosphatase n=1 Tax=Sphingopyxis sp. MC1 TaxID=1174684 RepID=UPI0002D157F3|nr:HAD family acid phosphatase [Sphingopyxis sp. MC1]ENY81781.1 5'-nucleotidase [Sphingopyxis sp. MC1]
MMRALALSAGLLLAGCAQTAATTAPAAPSAEVIASQVGEKPTPTSPPTGQQWLYGSAEGAIASAQVYRTMADYVRMAAISAAPRRQVVLAEGSTPAAPKFDDCGDKPLAAVFDADETLIWNLGAMRYFAEQGKDFDPAVWDQWEKTGAGKAVAMPGVIDALAIMRGAGVTIIVNTNRSAANPKGSEDTLRAAGLGDFKHGETLFLMGDTPDGASKDGRRALIASRWCVIAMGGDQLGDFAQAFNARGLSVADRKAMATSGPVAGLWGHGWFLLSNPVYGPSIRGGFADIFPSDKQWEPN